MLHFIKGYLANYCIIDGGLSQPCLSRMFDFLWWGTLGPKGMNPPTAARLRGPCGELAKGPLTDCRRCDRSEVRPQVPADRIHFALLIEIKLPVSKKDKGISSDKFTEVYKI